MTQETENGHDSYLLLELEVTRIWMAALGLEADFPSATSSFVDLGGDSIAAYLCMSRLRRKFGDELDVDISDFFDEKSTIENFARAILTSKSTKVV